MQIDMGVMVLNVNHQSHDFLWKALKEIKKRGATKAWLGARGGEELQCEFEMSLQWPLQSCCCRRFRSPNNAARRRQPRLKPGNGARAAGEAPAVKRSGRH